MRELMSEPRVLVIGGGLAGLAATMRLAELGIGVDLVSLVPEQVRTVHGHHVRRP